MNKKLIIVVALAVAAAALYGAAYYRQSSNAPAAAPATSSADSSAANPPKLSAGAIGPITFCGRAYRGSKITIEGVDVMARLSALGLDPKNAAARPICAEAAKIKAGQLLEQGYKFARAELADDTGRAFTGYYVTLGSLELVASPADDAIYIVTGQPKSLATTRIGSFR